MQKNCRSGGEAPACLGARERARVERTSGLQGGGIVSLRRHRCGTPRERQRWWTAHRRAARRRTARLCGRLGGRHRPGKGPARLVTLVDRKSGWTRLRKVPDRTATTVAEAVLSVLHPVHACVHTLPGTTAASSPSIDSSTSRSMPPATSRCRTRLGNAAAMKTSTASFGSTSRRTATSVSSPTHRSSRSKTSSTVVHGNNWTTEPQGECSSYPSNALHFVVELTPST